jgi:uncharacterized repeat protein (TIGR04076 family)
MSTNLHTAAASGARALTGRCKMYAVGSRSLWMGPRGFARRSLACLVVVAAVSPVVSMAVAGGSHGGDIQIWCDRQSRVFQCTVREKEVVLWDVDRGEIAARFRLPPGVVDAPPKHTSFCAVATKTRGLVALTTPDRHVVFDVRRNAVVSDRATDVLLYWHYDSGGRTFLAGSGPADGNRRVIKVYDAISGKEVRRWQFTPPEEVSGRGVWPVIFWMRFHPKGLVCIVMDDRSKRAPDETSETVVKDSQGREFPIPSYRSVFLWDLEGGNERWRVDRRYPQYFVEFSADARRLVVISKYDLQVWDAETARVLAHRDTPLDVTPISAQFSPHGRYVLCEEFSGRALLWDWKENALKQVYRIPGVEKYLDVNGPHYHAAGPHYRAMFSSDGKRIVAVSRELKVYEFDAMTGRLLKTARLLDGADYEKLEVLFPQRAACVASEFARRICGQSIWNLRAAPTALLSACR